MSSLLSLIAASGAISNAAQREFDDWSASNAPWIKIAHTQLGVREIGGTGRDKSNERINAYLQSCWQTESKYPDIDLEDDSTPWCSAFVNWCLLRVGIRGTGSTWSRSWLNWKGGVHLGTDLARAPIGSVVVLTRGDPKKEQGHVAFLWSMAGGKPQYLGGNQGDGTLNNRRSDRVSICHYPNKVLQCILPLTAIGPVPRAWSKGRIA